MIHHWPGLLAILLALVLNPTAGMSALVTIYDSGATRPISPFLDAFDATDAFPTQPLKPATPQIGAVGMLVQADTLDDLQAIAELAQGLPIIPASATDIGRALGISHYPVLISPKGIEQ